MTGATAPATREDDMAEAVHGRAVTRRDAYESRRRQLRRLVGASAVLFLPAVLLRRALALGQPRPAQRQSVFAEARAGAAAVIPFIFMG